MSILHGKKPLAPCPFCKRSVWAVYREGDSEFVFCCYCKAQGPSIRATEFRNVESETTPEQAWNQSLDHTRDHE